MVKQPQGADDDLKYTHSSSELATTSFDETVSECLSLLSDAPCASLLII